jgi:hypothetical protein
MKRLAIVALAAIPTLVASCGTHACDCAGPGVGLVVWTAAPITQVALSGSACEGGRFVCRRPLAADNTIPPGCTDVFIEPKATGDCIVDLTVGGTNIRLQHRMREIQICCGGDGTFIGDEDQVGFVDLRYPPDAGDGGLDATVD